MKKYSSQIKLYMSLLYLATIYFTPVHAQNTPVQDYLQQIGDYSILYNGKLESGYNSILYDNLPYYTSSYFVEGSIIYKNNFYPDVRLRLDLYKEQLIILPPEKKFYVIVNNNNVERVFMYNKTFVWMTPPKKSGLKTGYYILLLERENMQLLSKQSYLVQQNIITISFYNKKQYYLYFNEQYYTVKNKSSFLKIFPQFKKQINTFSKDNKLNFKNNADESLIALAGYCEELLTSTYE